MKFDQVFIEKVREATNLVDIIGEHTQLKGSGGRYMGICPFPDHAEKSASFSVSEDRQLYHCFGCKKSGNVFTFLETMLGLNFPQSVEWLAKRASIPLPESTDPQQEKRFREKKSKRDELFRINKLAGYYYFETLKKLPNNHPAKVYVEKRKINQEIVDSFKIGASLEEWDGLVRFFQTQKVNLKSAEALGLVRQKKSGVGYFDVLRGRIIFPILSQTREVIGFGGRSYIDEIKPKYLNSPETELFHKGRSFYGLHESAKHIRGQDEVIIVEGYMDALALHKAEVKNVVATLGTALTLEHAQHLKKFTSKVIVLFDGDQAGQAAAERSLSLLLQADTLPRGVKLPDNLDPDDYFEKFGKDSLQKSIRESQDLFELVLSNWMQSYVPSATERLRIIDLAAPILASVVSPRLKDLYLQILAQSLDQPVKWVIKSVSESKMKPSGPNSGLSSGATPKTYATGEDLERNEGQGHSVTQFDAEGVVLKDAPKDEILIFSLALKSRKLLEFLASSDDFNHFQHGALKELLIMVIEKARQKPEEFDKLGALIASQIDSPAFVTAYLGYGIQDLDGQGELKLLRDCLNRVRSRYLKGKARQLSHQLKQGTPPGHLEQIMNIHRDRLSLKKEES